MNNELKQGDWVLWQKDGKRGVGRVYLVVGSEDGSTYAWVMDPEHYGNPLAPAKYRRNINTNDCTKIDPAIAKVYGHNNV